MKERQVSLACAKLIGVPYEVMNCWELVQEFYRLEMGLELKHYFTDFPQTRDETKNLIYTNEGDFEKVTNPEFGDIIIFRIMGIESHVGVRIENESFIHSVRGTGSVIERVDKWKKSIVGYYRYKETE